MNVALFKKPSALLPIAMSLTAISMVLGHAAIFGVVHEADEGTVAHVFQFLMGVQVFAVMLFATKWLPQQPSQALRVIALQAFLGLFAIALVYWLT